MDNDNCCLSAQPEEERTSEFLSIVNCDESEVLDSRRWQEDPTLTAPNKNTIDPIFHFGKYKGLRISEVPVGYLSWVVSQEPKNRSFRRMREAARRWINAQAV